MTRALATRGAVAGLAFALTWGALQLGAQRPDSSIAWIPIGLACALLVGAGARHWLWLLVGIVGAGLLQRSPGVHVLFATLGLVAAAGLLAAYVDRGAIRRGFNQPSDVARFGLAAAIVAALPGASIALLYPVWHGPIPPGSFSHWLGSWMNAMVGILLIVPIVLGATRAAWQQLIEHRVIAVTLLVAAILFTIAAAQLAALNRGPWLGPPAVLLTVISAVRLNIAFTALLATWLTASLGFSYPTDVGEAASMIGPVRVWAFGTVLSALALTLQAVLTQQREAERKLHAAQLTHQQELLHVASIEQQRLARDMHDSLGQELTALSLLTQSLHARLAASDSALGSHAGEAAKAAKQALQSVRQIARGMIQGFCQPTDFADALHSLAARATQATGILVNVDLDQGRHPTQQPAESLYRIAQEAVSNVLRHAGAQRLDIRLRCTDEQCRLEVVDDGRGFDIQDSSANQGLGLRTMRYRCELAGGTLAIVSTPGGGTRVTALLPAQRQHVPATGPVAPRGGTRSDDAVRAPIAAL